MVETSHCSESAWVDALRIVHCDQCVCVCWVANNKNFDVLLCSSRNGLTLWFEDSTICTQQVATLHAVFTWHCTNKEGCVCVTKRNFCIVCALNTCEKWKCTVIKFHAHAFKRAERWCDFEQLQNHWSVRTKDGTRGNSEKEAVTNLASSSGNSDTNGSFHASKRRHSRLWNPNAGRPKNSFLASKALQNEGHVIVLTDRIQMHLVFGKPFRVRV